MYTKEINHYIELLRLADEGISNTVRIAILFAFVLMFCAECIASAIRFTSNKGE